MKFGIDILYKTQSDQEFRENRLVDSIAWVSDVNEFLRVLPIFLDRYEWKWLYEISSYCR